MLYYRPTNSIHMMIELFTYQIELTHILAALTAGLIINLTLLVFIVSRLKTKQSAAGAKQNETRDEHLPLDNNKLVAQLESQLPQSAIVRYNPFRDSGVGGKQSFSLALINKRGDGVIISQLFSREFSRVSAKEITAWESDLELSPEEVQVLKKLRSTK